ncbi:hypothetical protein pb186bvf_004315 [Paramecium bursaria]
MLDSDVCDQVFIKMDQIYTNMPSELTLNLEQDIKQSIQNGQESLIAGVKYITFSKNPWYLVSQNGEAFIYVKDMILFCSFDKNKQNASNFRRRCELFMNII